jgi:hypothetical protein
LEKGLRFCGGIWRSRYLEVEKAHCRRLDSATNSITADLNVGNSYTFASLLHE